MNDLTPLPPEDADLRRRLRDMTMEQLEQGLADRIGFTARGLLEAAYYVREMEERGRDLSGLKNALVPYLLKIAYGQLLPEVVVRFAGKPSLIAAVGSLPIPEQRRLASGEPVRLFVWGPDGRLTDRMADPLALTPRQVRQVFASDHLREKNEQALILDERREQARLPAPEQVGKLKLDRERQVATVGRHTLTLADLKLAVRLLEK
jgi:hypothetical protein